MALVKCKECAHEISSKATACPNCGFKIKSKSGCLSFFIVIFFTIIIVLYLSGKSKSNNNTSQEINNYSQPKYTDQKQQQTLKKLILDYTKAGILYKVESPSGTPRAYIGNKFSLLNIDEKNIVMGVIYNYYKNTDDTVSVVSIYDGSTGKHIGKFSEFGLDIN